MMKTIAIQIGNSDNKLTQMRWVTFIQKIREAVGLHCGQVHFDGGSRFDSQWQNFCVVAEIWPVDQDGLKKRLCEIKKEFDQDSIAITIGDTEFV